MDFDPRKVTGRTMPAQIPVPPQRLVGVAEPPGSAELPAQPAMTLGSPDVTPATSPGASTAVERTASPAGMATAAVAPASRRSRHREEADSPPPPAAGYVQPRLVPPISVPVGSGSSAVAVITDEERALLSVLRLVDRVVSPGTLSPSERAFITGAKVMFDQLSSECKKMLTRRVTDLTPSSPAHSGTPQLAGSKTPRAARGPGRTARKRAKSTPKAQKARGRKA
jgi:hypothetical protein